MKHLLNTLFIALAMLTPVASVAQRSIILEAQKHTKGGRTIVGAYKVATPLDAFVIMQGGTPGEPTAMLDGTKATLEIIPFGTQGRTVTITLNIPKMERSEEIDGTTFSWSGKVDVAPTIEGENSGFMITRRGNTLCAMLAYTEGKWVLCINKDDGTGLIGTLKKGISRAQVEDDTQEWQPRCLYPLLAQPDQTVERLRHRLPLCPAQRQEIRRLLLQRPGQARQVVHVFRLIENNIST